jgi:ketosteroid isomerase-like protein
MRLSLTVPLALLTLAAPAGGREADLTRQAPGPAYPTNDQRAVQAVIEDFFALAQRRDWDGVADLLAEDFEIYTDGAVGFDKPNYSQLLKDDDLIVERMELRDMTVRVSADGSMAWGKYRGSFVTSSHAGRQAVETAETLILHRESGAWRIARAHASIKPAPTPTTPR